MPLKRIKTLPQLPPRQSDSNKGTYGRILIVAGSAGMSGAAVLCGSAALRGGAGLVKIATPRDVWPIVASGNPCYMTIPLHQDAAGQFTAEALTQLLDAAKQCDVVALGPGLGRGPGLSKFIGELLGQIAAPLVLDADGLNACAEAPDILVHRSGPTIITPHPGEFSRLVSKPIKEIQAAREEMAVEFARRHKLCVLLKGHATVVTDGQRIYVNASGNPGMATAGSGDVLTGLIAALLGQKLEPFAAAQLGAYLHGLAGDRASADLGQVGVVATDLLAYLPKALKEHAAN